MQAVQTKLASQAQSRTVVKRSALRSTVPVTARRTYSGRTGQAAVMAATGKNVPNWLLDTPERLWEIGSRYWLPFKPYDPPAYLDGSLPGDRGFDPFRLGESRGSPPVKDGETPSDRERLGWLLEGELYNGRLAMLAVVGVLVVDFYQKGPWWTAPYTADWPFPYAAGVIGGHLIFALLEKKRLENWQEKGEAGHFGQAPFDPMGLTDDYKRQAEVRNCRLAMLTFLGFAVQAWVTGKGPIENAVDHLSNPFGANIFTYGDKGLQVVYTFLAFSVAMHLAESTRATAAKRA